MFSTSVREGRGGDEGCEWTTASSNRYGESARFRPASYRSAVPFLSTSSPQASLGASAAACSAKALRTAPGTWITKGSAPPSPLFRACERGRRDFHQRALAQAHARLVAAA